MAEWSGAVPPSRPPKPSRPPSMLHAITNARVVTPEEVIEDGTVVFEEGRISGILRRRLPAGDGVLDAEGRHLLPGLVDLHSDAIEKQISPRPGVEFPAEGALLEMDNYFLSSGITTGFHALSFMEDFARSIRRSKTLCEMVHRNRQEALARHELHLRCELPEEGSVEAVEELLRSGETGLVSVMDHTPGQGQFRDLEWFRRYSIQDSGAEESQVAEAITQARRGEHSFAIERVERLAEAARASGTPLASHDDDSPHRVELLAGRAVGISEFPVNVESARRARELDLSVCMGAPNVLRGGSSGGNLCATEAIGLGLVDVLCSDYHPPSMLRSAFKLAEYGIIDLPEAVRLVTSGPARATGMTDRGETREGALADLVLIGGRLGLPTVCQAVVGGRPSFLADHGRE